MPDTYTVKQGDDLWKIAKKHGVSWQELKQKNPGLAARQPPYGVNPGDVLTIPSKQKTGDVKDVRKKCPCKIIDLKAPFVVAIAKDNAAKSRTSGTSFTSTSDPDDGPMLFGEDATHGKGASLPGMLLSSAGKNTGDLKGKMNGLLGVFAPQDPAGNARRMFTEFQKPRTALEEYKDSKVDDQVARNQTFLDFSDLTLNAPVCNKKSSNRRIHQALKEAEWDINKVKTLDDLGPLAFTSGRLTPYGYLNTGDKANGLFVMFDGIQYVFVHVTKYHYDSCEKKYTIELEFHLYDVFGLDSEDIRTYGLGGTKYLEARAAATIASPILGNVFFPDAAFSGITAWWQLQHQFDYVPMITKAVVTRSWTVPTE